MKESPQALRVLIVEDSQTDRQLLERLLGRLGCECETAWDGLQGLLAACRGGHDYVFLDLEMPNLGGLAAARRIRTALGASCPFLVAVTSRTSEADTRRCMEAGIDHTIGKPASLRSLASLIDPEGTHAR